MTDPNTTDTTPASVSLRPYAPADASAVVALWNACPPLTADFPLDERLWRQNLDSCPATAWPACLVATESSGRVIGMIAVKLPRHISAIAVHPDYQRQGIGRALVEAAIAAVERGHSDSAGGRWTVGADLCHFFPGVPAQAESALAFFRALGFSVGGMDKAEYDLARDLAGFEIPASIAATIARLREQGIVLGPCRVEDIPALRAHLAETFPGRWLDDTMRRIEIENGDPSEIIIARDESAWGGDGTGMAVLGFAHTFSPRSRWLGPPVYWRAALGTRPGGLGPIGIAVRARKIGLGLALLAAGVQAVAETGADRMAIDWTTLLDFYAKLGFTSWKKYLPVWRAGTQ